MNMLLSVFGGMTGGGEILLVLVIALLLFGSKNLPKIARSIGRSMEEFRRAAKDVTDEVMRSDIMDDDEGRPARSGERKKLSPADEPEQEESAPEIRPAANTIKRDEAADQRD